MTTTFSRRIPPSPRSARKAKYPHQRRAREPHRPIQSARVADPRAYTWLSAAFWRRPTHRNDTPLHAQQAARVRESSLRPTRGATCKRITVSATPHQKVGRQDQYRKRGHSTVSSRIGRSAHGQTTHRRPRWHVVGAPSRPHHPPSSSPPTPTPHHVSSRQSTDVPTQARHPEPRLLLPTRSQYTPRRP